MTEIKERCDCKVCQYREECERVILAMGHDWAYITPQSTISDFCLEDDELEKLQATLGLRPIDRDDYIWQIAQRLRELGSGVNG